MLWDVVSAFRASDGWACSQLGEEPIEQTDSGGSSCKTVMDCYAATPELFPVMSSFDQIPEGNVMGLAVGYPEEAYNPDFGMHNDH
eukprot:380034-Karenia_brevis.AAC.1